MKAKRIVTTAMLIAMYVVPESFFDQLGKYENNARQPSDYCWSSTTGCPLDGFLIGFFGSFLNQLLTFGLTPTTIIWVLPAAIRGLLIGLYAKHCHFDMSFLQTQIITISTALIVTALNTGALYLDSKIYGYYSFAFVFGAVIPRIFTGILTAFVFGSILPYIVKPVKKFLGMKRV